MHGQRVPRSSLAVEERGSLLVPYSGRTQRFSIRYSYTVFVLVFAVGELTQRHFEIGGRCGRRCSDAESWKSHIARCFFGGLSNEGFQVSCSERFVMVSFSIVGHGSVARRPPLKKALFVPSLGLLPG